MLPWYPEHQAVSETSRESKRKQESEPLIGQGRLLRRMALFRLLVINDWRSDSSHRSEAQRCHASLALRFCF